MTHVIRHLVMEMLQVSGEKRVHGAGVSMQIGKRIRPPTSRMQKAVSLPTLFSIGTTSSWLQMSIDDRLFLDIVLAVSCHAGNAQAIGAI
jgi:hypothetical protein